MERSLSSSPELRWLVLAVAGAQGKMERSVSSRELCQSVPAQHGRWKKRRELGAVRRLAGLHNGLVALGRMQRQKAVPFHLEVTAPFMVAVATALRADPFLALADLLKAAGLPSREARRVGISKRDLLEVFAVEAFRRAKACYRMAVQDAAAAEDAWVRFVPMLWSGLREFDFLFVLAETYRVPEFDDLFVPVLEWKMSLVERGRAEGIGQLWPTAEDCAQAVHQLLLSLLAQPAVTAEDATQQVLALLSRPSTATGIPLVPR